MDQSEQQGNEQSATEATASAQDAQAAPAKTPRKRRTASAPAGAPPAVPVAAEVAESSRAAVEEETPAAPARKRTTRVRKSAVAATQEPTPADTALDSATAEHAAAAPTSTEPPEGEAAPKRATRTRRRAATAEAGPARTQDAPAHQVPGAAVAGAGAPEGGAAETGAVEKAAVENGAPAVDAAVDAGLAAAADTTDVPAAAVPPAEEEAEKPARSRRTSTRTRSRRASEPAGEPDAAAPQDVTDKGTTAAADTARATTGGAGNDVATEDATPARRAPRRRTARNAAAAEDPQREDAGSTPGTDEADTTSPGTGVTAAAEGPADEEQAAALDPFAVPESPLSLLFHAPDLTSATVPSVKVTPAPEEEDEDDPETGSEDSGRRSRRSRRGRSRNRSTSSSTDAGTGEDETESTEGRSGSTGPDDGAGTTSRRRRRRRRGDQDLELTGGEDDDPPNTVTRVRAPRASSEPASDRVTSVRGSTRLEAKKQRRRESRDTGRRRQVITEAEFLARRESVDRQMIVRQRDDRIQIGVLEDGILAEHFVSNTQQDSLIGNVYVGKVQNVLPSMEAAFIDIGRGRNAVLYAGEVNWDAAGLDGQPRRIELALKSGDPVLVQVTKDPVGHKGARLTSQISLPGRYLVYVPGGSMTGISRKLPDVERNRLKRILKDRLPENAGVIVRTAAEGASEEELTHDINRLRAQWEDIERKSGSTKTLAPELLYGEPDLTIKVVRDVFNEDFSKLVVSGEEAWDTIEAYVMYVAPDLVGRLEKWTSEEDIFSASRIDEQISKALDRKVFLPSGGSLVIDRTEAMTVVDVNTGKFTGSGGNLEETVTKNNLEAAEEVVRQLRLRDIGGIIVIDFIDMVLEANRDLVLRRLVECLGRDRTKHQVAEVTSLGLVQMTRKRMGTGLLEVFGEECEHCAGRGVITQAEPVEHRRHAAGPESQQQARQERPSRSERKRNRGRGSQQQDEAAPQPVPVVEDSAERAARAEAARAALASIAAATHHASGESVDQLPAVPDVQVTEAVLTINGETVTLPRADGRRAEETEVEDAPAPRLTLDSLSEAFNRPPARSAAPEDATTTGAASDAPDTDADQEVQGGRSRSLSRAQAQPTSDVPADAAPAGAPPARKARPRRVARSAQGAADTTIETQGADTGGEPTGTRHVAKATTAPRAAAPAADEPIMFGVGVPASEL